MMKQWYETLFENYAKSYDLENYIQGTVGEVDFIEQELCFDKSKNILDIGCGTGRHAIELARRGYKVTGVDLSKAQLERAKEKAKDSKLEVEFIQKDARELEFEGLFDAAIMICEGAFSLMETDEMNFKILQNAADALKENGKFIFTTLNALFALYHAEEKSQNRSQIELLLNNNRFDLMTFRKTSVLKFTDDSGKEKELICNERYYCPSEISWHLKSLNFREIGIYGCKLGAFSRDDKLSKDDFEMLVIAQK
jgi:2-polyprenyl-3-methyl-5-hydroxy-6-metoxy-1,4-benzoquinol methylase